jgi:putative ATPase
MDLFGEDSAESAVVAKAIPLAERMRPKSLDQIIGQDHAVGPNSPLGQLLADDSSPVPSMLFWGPPGVGKTTIARVIAEISNYRMVRLSGVLDGVAELRKVVVEAEKEASRTGQATLAVVDEIHRFNKAQQDAFLPHVESGLLTVIGMTTENVSFRLRNALLSRMRVIELKPLEDSVIVDLVGRALADLENGLGCLGLDIDADAAAFLARLSMGDARRALTCLEWASASTRANKRTTITKDDVEESFGNQPIRFDQDGDDHYDCISAFIKSMRGSDPEAALYYMLRALKGGEDPLFITRRMLIFASEDAGCDPRALEVAVNVDRAVERVGLPEAKIPMAQAAVYLSCCSKSNASYRAMHSMDKIVEEYPDLEIPRRLRNAPTELMKQMGNKEGYRYPHDFEGAFVPERYLPEELGDLEVYEPSDRGLEAQIKERLKQYRQMIKSRR